MDLSRLKELIDLMNRNQLEELELEEEEFRVRLRKKGEVVTEVVTMPAVSGVPAVGPAPSQAAPAPVPAGDVITSPMVGTFYSAPNPDSDSFVEVGDRIEEGTVLCIIEAMKVMNEIKAERSGTIEEVLVQNGESVEFGHPLFRLS